MRLRKNDKTPRTAGRPEEAPPRSAAHRGQTGDGVSTARWAAQPNATELSSQGSETHLSRRIAPHEDLGI